MINETTVQIHPPDGYRIFRNGEYREVTAPGGRRGNPCVRRPPWSRARLKGLPSGPALGIEALLPAVDVFRRLAVSLATGKSAVCAFRKANFQNQKTIESKDAPLASKYVLHIGKGFCRVEEEGKRKKSKAGKYLDCSKDFFV